MREELPKYIDPRPLVDQVKAYEGLISASKLSRITAPYAAKLPVSVQLEMSREGQSVPRAVGRIETALAAICQRCLAEMLVSVDKTFDVRLVETSASAGHDEDDTETVATVDGLFDLERFVEDEVILACPMIPLHNDQNCHAVTSDEQSVGEERTRPFANLGEMLAKSPNKRT